MSEVTCAVPIPKTPQELEQALQHYRETDLKGVELYCELQAICEATQTQTFAESDTDQVSGADSY